MEKEIRIPQHVAIILDGNGRWAKSKHMPRNYGHTQGSKTVEIICEDAYKLGIQYLTVYAFSTENWTRPKEEVEGLMGLLRTYLKDCIKTSKKNNMRVRIIGDRSRLDADIVNSIEALENASKDNTGLNFQVAINYGGRDEIIRVIQILAEKIKENQLMPEQIDEKLIGDYLDTAGIPEPDLLIRTAGEQRISNFLLWQASYCELYFTEVLWPDFTKKDLEKAIAFYNTRERRYGGV